MTDKSYFDYLIEIASMMEINHQCIYDEKTCQNGEYAVTLIRV